MRPISRSTGLALHGVLLQLHHSSSGATPVPGILPLRGVRARSALGPGARVGGTLSAVRGKFASTEGVLCSFAPDTVAGHNVNLLFSSLAPSGGGSRPAAGTPSAPPVEALVWHCAVAARTPPQACLQRRQWRLLSAMFSRELMTIQTGVLNVFKWVVFVETRTSVQRPAPCSNVCFCQSRSKICARCFCNGW